MAPIAWTEWIAGSIKSDAISTCGSHILRQQHDRLNLIFQTKCKLAFRAAVQARTDCNDIISGLSYYDLGRVLYIRLARADSANGFPLTKVLKVLAVDTSGTLCTHANTGYEQFKDGSTLTGRWRMEISERLRLLATWDHHGPIGVIFKTAENGIMPYAPYSCKDDTD